LGKGRKRRTDFTQRRDRCSSERKGKKGLGGVKELQPRENNSKREVTLRGRRNVRRVTVDRNLQGKKGRG